MIARILIFFVPFLLVNLALDAYVWRHLRCSFPAWSPKQRLRVFCIYAAIQLLWYVTLPLAGAIGYEGLPALFRNFFQTYVLIAITFKAWALPWWALSDLLGGVKRIILRFRQHDSEASRSLSATVSDEIQESQGLAKGASMSRADFLSRLGFLIGTIPLLGLGGSALTGTAYRYKVHRLTISLRGLAPSWRGKRIVQISDLHTGSWDHREAIQRGVDLIQSLNPDLIFFTGDLVNTRAAELEPWMDILAQIRAPLGVFSILGNHDYGDYTQWPDQQSKADNFENLVAAHKALGWNLLRNEWCSIRNDAGDFIHLVGSENWGKRSGFGKQYGDLKKAMMGIPQGGPVILLTHDPSHFDKEVLGKYPGIDLTLCGHTHGMQMGIEVPGYIRWSPASWVYPHWAGHYTMGEQQLYVNRGFGFVGFRGRLGIYPEITCLELG